MRFPGDGIGVVEVRLITDGGVVNHRIAPLLQHGFHGFGNGDDAFFRILRAVARDVRIGITLGAMGVHQQDHRL